MVAGVVVTAISLTLALVVVPSRTGMPLLETAWWVGVPDLAVSVGLMLAFSAWTIVLLVCRLVRRPSRDARAHGVAAQRQNTYG